jgi:protein-S-isoprenylcysteine O-methyltransferase Ste14
MKLETISLLLSCLGSLTLYAAASKRMFVAPNGVPTQMKVIATSFTVCALIQLVAIAGQAAPSLFPFVAASLLYLASLVLFWAAGNANRTRWLSVAYSSDVPQHLVNCGPYRFIRHPYYASYCLTWLAGAISVAQSRSMVFVTFLLMTLLYVRAAKFEENKYSGSLLADDYQSYKRQTGMFIPRCCLAKPRASCRQD